MKLLLTEWAKKHYDPPPPLFTLRRWARDGEIWPAPEKAGKAWYVDETAVRLGSGGMGLVERMRA